MRQWIIICIGAILLLIGAGNHFLKISNSIDEEMQAYVHNLNYDFTAKIDSVILLKKGGGYLICKITSGRCNRSTEDSLNQHLTNFKRIRFLYFKPKDQFLMVSGHANRLRPMDSVVVNSNQDQFYVFRNGQNILKNKVSHSTRHKVRFAFWIKD